MDNRYIYRGKRADGGEWLYGDLAIDQYGMYYIHPNANAFSVNEYNLAKCIQMIEVIPETVGQCTGLTDKNGKLIFEGDILRFENDDGETSNYEVYWSNDEAGWCIKKVDAFDAMDCWDESRERFEVIGNIHDNPELLEVQNG